MNENKDRSELTGTVTKTSLVSLFGQCGGVADNDENADVGT
jgi:hypothetical protein